MATTDELSQEEEKTDWYAVLGLEVAASEKAINKSFKKMSLVWHPDKNGGSEEAHAKFMKIKEAKLFLLDAKKRKLYDERRAARRKTEALLAERNRSMGQRQRELRAELERREKEAASGASPSPSGARGGGGLGAGGEARVAAAKLDELRKRGEAERQRQSADWSVKSASAKKRARASAGLSGVGGDADGDNDGLEERTIRVKWKAKKESHSDYTLDLLFSKFGVVQSVSIEEGKGDRALVVFELAASADAAMAAYGDREGSETMRTSYVGKRRPKRSAFAPRRQTMSPKTPTPTSAGGGGEAGQSLSSFRDHESVVMMNLRKEAERQSLMRKMAEEEGLALNHDGKSAVAGAAGGAAAARTAAVAPTTPGAAGGVDGGERKEPPGPSSNGGTPAASLDPSRLDGEGRDADAAAGASAPPAAEAASVDDGRSSSAQFAAGRGVSADRRRPAFPVPSPMAARVMSAPSDLKTRRKSDAVLPATMGSGGGGLEFGGHGGAAVPAVGSGFGIGSKSVPTTPVSGRSSAGNAIDENDILARMMAMKR